MAQRTFVSRVLQLSLVALASGGTVGAARDALAADPTTADCLSASETSIKLGNAHKLRAQRAQLLVCSSTNCPADIRRECLARVEQVNAQIPTIVFAAKDPSGADLTDVKVSMDGEPLAPRLEGSAVSLDPGEHAFTFETEGQSPIVRKLVLVQGQKDRRELVRFGKPPEPSPVTAEPGAGLGGQKIGALTVASAGIVGLAIGTAFGVMTLSRKREAASLCSTDCTTQAGVNAWHSAYSAGLVSTAAFVAGGIAVAGGIVLWATAPSANASTQVGLTPGGIQVRGAW